MLRCRLPSLPRHLHIIKSGDMLVLLLTLTIAVFFIDGFQLVNLNDSNPADAELRPFKLWNPLTLWIAEKVLLHAWSVTLILLFLAKAVSRFWNDEAVDAIVLCASLGVAGFFQLCQMFAHTGHLLPYACLIIFYFFTGFPLWILRLVCVGTAVLCCVLDMALRPCAAPVLALRLVLSLLLCLAGRAAYHCTFLLGVQICESKDPNYCANFLDRGRSSVSVSSGGSLVSPLEPLSSDSEWDIKEGRSECGEESSGEDSSSELGDDGMNGQMDSSSPSDCRSAAAASSSRFAVSARSAREVVVTPGEVFAEGWEGLCSIKHRALRNRQFLRTKDIFEDFTSINEEHHRTWPQRDRSSLAVVRNAWPSSCPRGQQLRLFSCWGCFPSKSDRLGDRTTDAPSVYHRGTSPEYPSPALQPKRILEQGSSSTVSQFPSSLEARAGLRAPRDGVSSPAGRRTCSQGGSWEDKQRTNEDRALRESGQGCRVSECPDVECGLGSPRDLISGRGVSPRACVLEATQGAAGSNESFITSQGNMTLDPTVNLENGAFDLDSHDVAGDCSVKSESVGRPSGNIRDRATTGIRAVGLPSGKNNEPAERPEFCTTEPDIASEAPRMKRSPGSFLAEPITSTEKPVLRKGKTVTGIDRQGSTRTAAAIETKGARRHSAPVKTWSFEATLMEFSDRHSVRRFDRSGDLLKDVQTRLFQESRRTFWRGRAFATLEEAAWVNEVPTPAMSPLGVFKDGTIEEWYLIWRAENISLFYKRMMKTNLFLNLINTIFVSLVMFSSQALAISKDEGFSTAARLLTVFFGVVRQEGGWVCLRSVAQLVIVAALVLPMGFMASRKGRNAWRFHLLGCGLAFTHVAFVLLDTCKVIQLAARRSASGAVLRVDSGSQTHEVTLCVHSKERVEALLRLKIYECFALIPLLMIALQLQVRGPITAAVLVLTVCCHSLVAVFCISQADSPTNAGLSIFLEVSVYTVFLVVAVLAFEFNRRRMFCAYILPSLLYLSTLSAGKAGRLVSAEKRR